MTILGDQDDVVGSKPTIRVLLADERALFRESVRVALERESDIQVVAQARDGLEAMAEAERTRPDVAVLDVALPTCDGIGATRLLADALPDCRILVLAPSEDLNTLVLALESGASGFLTKDRPLVELIAATRAIHAQEMVVPPTMFGGLLRRLLDQRREQGEALRRVSRLTRREREVLSLLAQGADNKRIAQRLVISPETARTHIQRVLSRLGVHSRLEAAMFVTRTGILKDLDVADPLARPSVERTS